MDKQLHIVAIGAHTGDMELTAGAVLAKYSRAGHRVTLVSLTLGEKGHPQLDPEEYARQKKREGQAAAAVLGAETVFLPYKDAELPVNEESILQVADLLRQLKPDIVITHWQKSIHRDHVAAHEIVRAARFYAGLKTFKSQWPAHWVGRLYFADNWEDAQEFEPQVFIDITPVRDLWIQAMQEFAFARGETSRFPYIEYYKALSVVRGAPAGFPYAQAFSVPPEALKQRLEFFPL